MAFNTAYSSLPFLYF